jgi:hypothetical protein
MYRKTTFTLFAIFVLTTLSPAIASAALPSDSDAILAGDVDFTAGSALSGYIDYAVYAPGDYLGSVSFPHSQNEYPLLLFFHNMWTGQ